MSCVMGKNWFLLSSSLWQFIRWLNSRWQETASKDPGRCSRSILWVALAQVVSNCINNNNYYLFYSTWHQILIGNRTWLAFGLIVWSIDCQKIVYWLLDQQLHSAHTQLKKINSCLCGMWIKACKLFPLLACDFPSMVWVMGAALTNCLEYAFMLTAEQNIN